MRKTKILLNDAKANLLNLGEVNKVEKIEVEESIIVQNSNIFDSLTKKISSFDFNKYTEKQWNHINSFTIISNLIFLSKKLEDSNKKKGAALCCNYITDGLIYDRIGQAIAVN